MNKEYSAPTPIDLGLSIEWASFNLGATTPEECGDLFAWGETETKGIYTRKTYKSNDSKELLLDDDAAYKAFGQTWRMPRYDEFKELIDWCNVYYDKVRYRGRWIEGLTIRSRKIGNINKIFLPCGPVRNDDSEYRIPSNLTTYWSSSRDDSFRGKALFFELINAKKYGVEPYRDKGRVEILPTPFYIGCYIRPVKGPKRKIDSKRALIERLKSGKILWDKDLKTLEQMYDGDSLFHAASIGWDVYFSIEKDAMVIFAGKTKDAQCWNKIYDYESDDDILISLLLNHHISDDIANHIISGLMPDVLNPSVVIPFLGNKNISEQTIVQLHSKSVSPESRKYIESDSRYIQYQNRIKAVRGDRVIDQIMNFFGGVVSVILFWGGIALAVFLLLKLLFG